MPVTRHKCPFCGATIFCNDEEKKISHQAPECARFAALMHSGRVRVDTFAESLDSETGAPIGRPKA